jgi:hypothetical protein
MGAAHPARRELEIKMCIVKSIMGWSCVVEFPTEVIYSFLEVLK